MFKTNSGRQTFLAVGLIALVFLALMLIMSGTTSPLYFSNGFDSGIFSLLGKGLVEGKTLYTELFDHKGPVIFLINALGHAIGGRTGIFLLQCIFGLAGILILASCVALLREDRPGNYLRDSLIIFAAGFAFFFLSFDSGNLTEEYSLPFISLSLWLFVKYSLRAGDETCHPLGYAFVHGICFAVLAFTRLNNAITVAAGILAIGIWLIKKGEIKNLLLNLLAGLLGIGAVSLPICLYFHSTGALDQMIYATFLYNFGIVGQASHHSLLSNPGIYLCLYLLPMGGCLMLLAEKLIRERKLCFIDMLLLCILLFNALGLWVVNRFHHYFTVFVPVYIVFMARYLRFDWKKLSLYLLLMGTLLCLRYEAMRAYWSLEDRFITGASLHQHETVGDSLRTIPEDERHSILGFNIPAYYYLDGDVLPCYKYYTHQETWASIDPAIVSDTLAYIAQKHPLWLITFPDETNPQLLDIISKNYSLIQDNEFIRLYRYADA